MLDVPHESESDMRVLVTGATGYIGSRLVPALVAEGHDVIAATRGVDIDDFAWGPDVTAVAFDADDDETVQAATEGVDALVYLVHSLDLRDFVERDREAAERVARAAVTNGVGRIVYLSGLIPAGKLSDHLRSRLEVEQVFLDSGVPTVSLRAAMVVGSGSTSFELMRRVSQRLPFTPIPTWLRSTLQPIAAEDVVELIAASLRGEPRNRPYDIGGPETPTYPELLALFAQVAGLRRLRIPVPFVPSWLVGLVVAAVAEMPRSTVRALIESLSVDMVCADDDALVELLEGDHTFVTLRDAIERSLGLANNATSRGADVQVGAPTDAVWAGGWSRFLPGWAPVRPATP